MCTEYVENGLQVGLHRARHVLDSWSSWTPCTRARSHHCRVAAAGRRAYYPSATRCRTPYSSITERQSCPLHSPPPSASSVRLVSLLVPPASAMDRERSSMSDRHQAPYCPIDHPGSFPTSHCLAMPPYPAVPLPVTRRRRSACRGCRLNAWPRCVKLSQSKPWPPAGVHGPKHDAPPTHRRRQSSYGRQ